ncbi:AbiV family abortive infection protein [Bradyrhizobium sp. RDI18]|uniref:AbiV family abortive infection protein n=1 Tax=Bradyrhizobium sp. RDI18 TaxID=3367400 RepID=UPI0037205E3E
MRELSLRTICEGIIRVRDNASELLVDAKVLRQNGRISRAYSLAYLACEEAGKLPILLGAATKIALDLPVDWKLTRKRFNSHGSKASQFVGVGGMIPILLQAAATEQKTLDLSELIRKGAFGVMFGPALFTTRNASIYRDFTRGSFTSPEEQITEQMADGMIEHAENHISVANTMFGQSAEQAIAAVTSHASRERYDKIMSLVAETAETVHSAFQKES